MEYTKEWFYHDMQDAWAELHNCDKGVSTFSMFETVSDRGQNWQVKSIDFTKEGPIAEGKFKVVIIDKPGEFVNMTNPTWKDIAVFFHENNDGHHVFLEDIKINDGSIVLGTGS